MSRAISYIPRAVIFLAGVAAGALTSSRRHRSGPDNAAVDDLKQSLVDLNSRMQAKEAAVEARLQQVESRLDEHAARFSDVPSTNQIVAAMEQLLAKTMASLDERLALQANSIEVLKTTVSQTDGLLERVLESLDSLHTYTDPAEISQDPLLSRQAH